MTDAEPSGGGPRQASTLPAPPPLSASQTDRPRRPIAYEVTGSAAHSRIAKLLPPDWVDRTPLPAAAAVRRRRAAATSSSSDGLLRDEDDEEEEEEEEGREDESAAVVDFLWENSPRSHARPYRDGSSCHSHLPNGTSVLDDKWALARLTTAAASDSAEAERSKSSDEDGGGGARGGRRADGEVGGGGASSGGGRGRGGRRRWPSPATLESHCFRGPGGFRSFAERVGLSEGSTGGDEEGGDSRSEGGPSTPPSDPPPLERRRFRDLLPEFDGGDDGGPLSSSRPPPSPRNLWAVKDAGSNGAGGIWIVGPSNAGTFAGEGGRSASKTPLIEGHRYVAQRYAWPPVLHGGRKCHVRAYGLITSDGRAYVHRRAFLHVANEPFRFRDFDGDGGSGGNNDGNFGEKPRRNGDGDAELFEASVHITNCCANSHDPDKFAGEICADFFAEKFREAEEEGDAFTVVPLAQFFPSVCASVATLAERSLPFLGGGEANNGFEYLGLDFVLSHEYDDGGERDGGTPVAYLLEVNAPPSQDTATGLPRAERLHDDVVNDILSLWVIPRVTERRPDRRPVPSEPGGWECVYGDREGSEATTTTEKRDEGKGTSMIVPSKAAILNKVRWAIFERKMAKLCDDDVVADDARPRRKTIRDRDGGSDPTGPAAAAPSQRTATTPTADDVARFARSRFPYFAGVDDGRSDAATRDGPMSPPPPTIFFENAGGAQVPSSVVRSVSSSLVRRHRSSVGAASVRDARRALTALLGGGTPRRAWSTFLGPNATTLLRRLADRYVDSGSIRPNDEIVIATENHRANVDPWVDAARRTGAKVRWWTTTDNGDAAAAATTTATPTDPMTPPLSSSSDLSLLLSSKTRIVAIAHASNTLGRIRDVASVRAAARRATNGRAHVVADGAAAAPHRFPDLSGDDDAPDWYAVSCHKLYGPHLGGLCGRRSVVREVIVGFDDDDGGIGGGRSRSLTERRGRGDDDMEEEEDDDDDDDDEAMHKSFEMGTPNFEACAGVRGLAEYFRSLADFRPRTRASGHGGDDGPPDDSDPVPSRDRRRRSQASNQCTESLRDREGDRPTPVGSQTGRDGTETSDSSAAAAAAAGPGISVREARTAFERIRLAERPLTAALLPRLRACPKVRVVGDAASSVRSPEGTDGAATSSNDDDDDDNRLPIVSFVHDAIPSSVIVRRCRESGIVCRCGTFLNTHMLLTEQGLATTTTRRTTDRAVERSAVADADEEGLVRVSMAHYNTIEEVQALVDVLESMDGWR